MSDKQIQHQVGQVFEKAPDHKTAITEVSAILERSFGGRVLLVLVPDGKSPISIAQRAEEFFNETAEWPCRALYSVTLSQYGREWGRLVAFFAGVGSHEGASQPLIRRVGEGIEKLLEKSWTWSHAA